MMYFVWYDDNPKKPDNEKLREAITAYVARFTTSPVLILVNTNDKLELAGVEIRSERTVQPNTFWLGYEETAALPLAEA